MALESTRRSIITGLIALVAAPAIVRAGSLMPVKAVSWDAGTGTVGLGCVAPHSVLAHCDRLFFALTDGQMFEIGEAILESAARSAARIAVHNRTPQ